jgi:outer membrane protein assembly factor BamD
VQEVLARREYDIGHFYYMRDSYPAAIARLKSVSDTYPLYSGADDALFDLGGAYEKQIEAIRHSKLPETAKGALIKKYTEGAVAAYDRILTVYPLEARAPDARKRLEAMKQPIPKATPQAVAANKAQIESRGSLGTIGKVMENFHKGPDVTEATKVGEPTLVDPKQASAPEMVRSANESVKSILEGAGIGNHLSVEQVQGGALPPENAPIPHSDSAAGSAAPDAAAASTAGAASTTGAASDAAAPSGQAAGSEMSNDLPASTAPLPPPTQVNDLANSGSNSSSGTTAAASSTTQAAPVNTDTESSSKKKKKHKLLPF